MQRYFLRLIFTLLISLFTIKTWAQHLPNKQTKSILISSPIKIDGSYKDWTMGFKAYNNSTSLFYSVAHDRENFYMILKATKSAIYGKIIGGTMTLSFKDFSDKKKHFEIYYPLVGYADRPKISMLVVDTPKKSLAFINQYVLSKCDEIKVLGCEAIPDSLISIYNEYGIKAAAGFDENSAFILEYSIPLKYLTKLKNGIELNYNVRVNPIPIKTNRKGPETEKTLILRQIMIDKMGTAYLDSISPTDFSGTYLISNQ